MDNPFVSVIIPVYNVAYYLSACLDSILRENAIISIPGGGG